MIRLTYILSALALGLIIFNAFKINWAAPLEGESMVAVISVLASACGIMLLGILRLSIRVKKASEKN
jgi:biotin transporter BioY